MAYKSSRKWMSIFAMNQGDTTVKYGLNADEFGDRLISSEGSPDEDPSELAIGHLTGSHEFQQYFKQRQFSGGQLQTVQSRLRLYKELRIADPEGFSSLWQRGGVLQHDSCPVPTSVLALEYILVAFLTALLVVTAGVAYYQEERMLVSASLLAIWAGANVARWLTCRPVFGPPLELWWEETAWGHKCAPFFYV